MNSRTQMLGYGLLIGLGTGLFLAGCTKRPVPDDTLVIAIESEVRNLHLQGNTDQNSVHLARLFTQALVQIGPRLLPEPDLAARWEIKDGRRYIFHLEPEALFHDGHPVTSADVEYNFRDAAESPRSRIKSSFEDVESFSSPDAHTFVIVLKKPRASFLADDVAAIRIYPKHLMEKGDWDTTPVGSGPFRFTGREGRDLVFERYDAFRPARKTAFRVVRVRPVEDPITRYLSLAGGDVDLVSNGLSPVKVKDAEKSPRLQVLRGPGSSYQYIGINLRNPKLKDPRVREALSLALNREDIIRYKLQGLAQPANSVLSPMNAFRETTIQPDPYDPERARRLLKEAGAENLELEFKTSSDREVVSNALILQDQFARVGVKVRIRSFEFPTFYADVQGGNFDLFTLRWTAVVEPDLLRRIFHTKEVPPGKNRGFYSNPPLDALLDRAAAEVDFEKRKALYGEAQKILARERPYISLWYPDNIVVATNKLKNFQLSPTGSWMPLLDAHKESSP